MSTQRQFLLGMFFLVAVSILAFYTLFQADISFFRDPVQMTVYFPAANGLREGDPVLFLGMRSGRVKSLDYVSANTRDRSIRALLNLKQEIELMEGFEIAIKESTLLGGHQIDIDPGIPGGKPAPLPSDGAYQGVLQANPIAALGSIGTLLEENRGRVENILSNVDGIAADFRVVVAETKEGKGLVGRILRDETLAADAEAAVANLKTLSESALRISQELEEGKGLLGELLRDEGLVATVKSTVESVQRIVGDVEAGKGLVGAALKDEELARSAKAAVAKLSEFVERVSSNQGLLNTMLSDEAFAADARSLLSNASAASESVRAIVAHVEAGEGTLGQIVMREELFDKLATGLDLLTRSLEDYREAAPISTFTSVLFSAF